jgi:hypothetical protein
MATISKLQKKAKQAPKFVLFTNEFGFDMFICGGESVITDNSDEAMKFSVGFDDEKMKLRAWSACTGYKLQVVKL